MFEHYPLPNRLQKQPTNVEQWALREAKSPTMAADLVQALAPARQRILRGHRRRWVLLTLGVASAIAVAWVRLQ